MIWALGSYVLLKKQSIWQNYPDLSDRTLVIHLRTLLKPHRQWFFTSAIHARAARMQVATRRSIEVALRPNGFKHNYLSDRESLLL